MAKIGDYAVIGDCRSAALISSSGSLDWLCWPQFDSPAIFAALLDPDIGGHWFVGCNQSVRTERAYVQDSNVLETDFICDGGRATLTDLMPVYSEQFKQRNLVPDHQLIRELRCTDGQVEMSVEFNPRRYYGSAPVKVRAVGSLGLRVDTGGGAYWLRSSVPLVSHGDRATAFLAMKEGDVAQFSLTYSEEAPSVLPLLGGSIRRAIDDSVSWWQRWIGRCSYDGPYRDAVRRSALAVKLLTYAPSGAIVAAPTTSLPEIIGDTLNWDYRYCWLRDASLTIRALLGCGYAEESESFMTWLLHATRMTQPELRVLYTVFGDTPPREKELGHLKGYGGSRPVRIGNAAYEQFQLDIYGEVIGAAAEFAQHGNRFDRSMQKVLTGFGKYVARNWNQPDEGIWEPRGTRLHHTHSRLMCWTALDRLLALNEKGVIEEMPRNWFMRERDRIRVQIESRAWNETLQSYVSVLDGDQMDATLLRLAWFGFEYPDSTRMRNTYRRVSEQLGAGNSLFYRYKRQPAEGAFGLCGFWAVEHLALCEETLQQAQDAFQQILSYRNDVGLYAEETDPLEAEALGNFPQGFTHVGLISAALTLAERERRKAPAIHMSAEVKSSSGEANA